MVTQAQSNLLTMRKLARSSPSAMFGFGFALVPFYQKICEVTGVNNVIKADEVGEHAGRRRASCHGRVRFQPAQQSAMDVPPAADERAHTSRRADDGDVRDQEQLGARGHRPGDPELRAAGWRGVISRSSNASASRSRRCSRAKRRQMPVVVRDRTRTAGGREYDHACRIRFSKSKAPPGKPVDDDERSAKAGQGNAAAGGESGVLVVFRHPQARGIREGRGVADAAASDRRRHHRRGDFCLESGHAGAFHHSADG